jgi:hypothetical protein
MLLAILMFAMLVVSIFFTLVAVKRSHGIGEKIQSLSDCICFFCLAMVVAFFFYCLCIIAPLEAITKKTIVVPETMQAVTTVPKWLWPSKEPVVTDVICNVFDRVKGE